MQSSNNLEILQQQEAKTNNNNNNNNNNHAGSSNNTLDSVQRQMEQHLTAVSWYDVLSIYYQASVITNNLFTHQVISQWTIELISCM